MPAPVASSEAIWPAAVRKRFLELSPGERQAMGRAGRAKREREHDQALVIDACREAMDNPVTTRHGCR